MKIKRRTLVKIWSMTIMYYFTCWENRVLQLVSEQVGPSSQVVESRSVVCQLITAEFSKCIKFENGLRAEIKRAIGYQKIRQFSELVSSCRIYEEDTKAHYKVMNERKSKSQQSRPKPYNAHADKGKQRAIDLTPYF